MEEKATRSIKRGRGSFLRNCVAPDRSSRVLGGKGSNLFRGRRRVNYDSSGLKERKKERKGWVGWEPMKEESVRRGRQVSLMGATTGASNEASDSTCAEQASARICVNRRENFIFRGENLPYLGEHRLVSCLASVMQSVERENVLQLVRMFGNERRV